MAPRKKPAGDTATKTVGNYTKMAQDRGVKQQIKRMTRLSMGSIFKGANSYTGMGGGSSDISGATNANFFSPQLSTDFLELPQSDREKREIYWHYYRNDPLVAQALDVLTEIPLSKVRLAKPKCESLELSEKSYAFFEHMVDDMDLSEKLHDITFRYWLEGNVFIFAEDDDRVGDSYRGWRNLKILEPDQIKVEFFGFGSDEISMEFIPTEEDKRAVRDADSNPIAARYVSHMPPEIVEYIIQGQNLPLDTDPNTGSFCYHMARRRRGGGLGYSILERCLRCLTYREKLRQAQTSIASRAMTPKRVIWGENLDEAQLDDLRSQVDFAMMDPDFSIIANYQVNWEDHGANDRLLDLSSEYEITDRQLMTGMGVTLELLTGEGSYTGNRLSLHVMNERFVRYREVIQKYVENYLFKPVAIRKGFVEKDKWGFENAIYPKLSFNRLALMDNQDVFSSLMDLYQKGSLPVDFLLELFNIDYHDVQGKLKRDFGTLSDASMNEALRSAYGSVGSKLGDESDLLEKVATHLGLTMKPPEADGGRF